MVVGALGNGGAGCAGRRPRFGASYPDGIFDVHVANGSEVAKQAPKPAALAA